MVKLSVVITTRNRAYKLLQCISSVLSSDYVENYEIIVVDDASTDDTQDIVHKFIDSNCHQRIRYIKNDQQLMMVRSRNLGAKASVGKYILFIDDDNCIDRSMINVLIQHIENHPDVGIIGPAMYARAANTPYLLYQRISKYTGRTKGYNTSQSIINESDGVPNVFMIRASVMHECDFFDERIVQTFTEPDFAANAKRNGYNCVMHSQAKTYHDVELNGLILQIKLNIYSQKAYFSLRNRGLYIIKYGSKANKLIYFGLFAHVWPFIYVTTSIYAKKYNVAKLYFWGYIDSLKILFSGNVPSFEKALAFVRRKMA